MAGFIVEVIEYAGTLNQVAGFVVGVAAVDFSIARASGVFRPSAKL